MKNPLLDYNFLKALDKHRNRITYVRVTSLTTDQYPIECIEGIVTAGTINIDGKSAVRRVCNLTFTTEKLNINNIYWGLSTRIKIEIGLENNVIHINEDGTIIDYKKIYPDIIWFPQGVFIINSFKTSAQTKKYQIQLTAKDKMCLLNGDISGNFTAETKLDDERVPVCEKIKFGTLYNKNLKYYRKISNSTIYDKVTQEEIENSDWDTLVKNGIYSWDGYSWINEKKSIFYIIREMIHYYAQESFQNIIIKDIDTLSLKVLNNQKTTFYLINDFTTNEIHIVDIWNEDPTENKISNYFYLQYPNIRVDFNNLLKNFCFQSMTDEDNNSLIETDKPWIIIDQNNKKYTVIRINYGEDIGYELINTYYPDELIGGVGETVTSILDKIIKTFGDYEYFYNLNGQFVFQKRQTYVNTAWNNEIKLDNEYYIEPSMLSQQIKYNFESSELTTAYQNNANLGKIKNDFTIWGEKKSANGEAIPIHMRYAIDHKAEYYHAYNNIIYISQKFYENQILKRIEENKLESNFLEKNKNYQIVDWREIIYQMANDYYKYGHEDNFSLMIQRNNIDNQLNINFYEQGKTNYEQYYYDLNGFWRLLYAPEDYFTDDYELGNITDYSVNKQNFYEIISNNNSLLTTYGKYIGPWNKNIIEDPSALIFWFDFYESENAGIGQFSVPAIGSRPKNKKNEQVGALIYKDIPDIIFITKQDYEYYYNNNQLLTGYDYIFLDDYPNIQNYLNNDNITISTRTITAQEQIDDLLYNFAYFNDNITITSVPIYYLEPNTIISAQDTKRMINGNYIINKITLPLNYKGTMKITAIKVPERIY